MRFLVPVLVAGMFAAFATALATTPARGGSPRQLATAPACKSGSVPARIGGVRVCLRVGMKCRARYEPGYNKKGFHCANGRLRKRAPQTPPATPPPPPQALAGRYSFTTTQCAAPPLCNIGTVEVLPGGQSWTNFAMPYSAQCTPPHPYHDVLTTQRDMSFPLGPSLTFAVGGSVTGNNVTLTADINGRFDTAGGISGTFDLHISANDRAGTHYECDTGQQSFSGKLR